MPNHIVAFPTVHDAIHDDPANDILDKQFSRLSPPENPPPGWDRWIVGTLGSEKVFEISLVMRSNYHGRRSWGWDEVGRKEIVAERSSGALGLRLFKATWTALIAVAQAECDLRNAATGDES